ncbi:ABC transporter substrate-binding protein [soil metagenome]
MIKNLLTLALAASIAGTAFSASNEPGVTSDTILLGQTVGLTGTVAGPVKETNEGAQAYFDLVNKKGGVHGRKIQLLTLDDKFDPKLTAQNAETLISKEKVFALFQGRGTPHTQAILPLLAAHNIPLVGPSTGSTVFHTPVNRLVFNIRSKYQDEVVMAVGQFATVGITRIALLHVDDAFGQDGLAGFNKAMEMRKLQPTIITKFERVNPDYVKTAETVMKAKPQALVIVSSAKNTVEVIKAFRNAGSKIQIMTLSNNSSGSFIKELGNASSGVIISQVMPAPYSLTTPLGQEFKVAARASGATVSYAAMEGYVNAKVLVEGLRRAGRNLTREGLIKGLESMQHVDMGGILITYGENDHTGSEFVELTMINKTGQFIR